jgi:hypothetical protein
VLDHLVLVGGTAGLVGPIQQGGGAQDLRRRQLSSCFTTIFRRYASELLASRTRGQVGYAETMADCTASFARGGPRRRRTPGAAAGATWRTRAGRTPPRPGLAWCPPRPISDHP